MEKYPSPLPYLYIVDEFDLKSVKDFDLWFFLHP